MEDAEKAENAMKQAIKDKEEKEMQLEDWVTRINSNFMKLYEQFMKYINLYILSVNP